MQSSGDALQHQQKEATLGELKRQQKNSVKSVATSKNVNCLGRCHDAKEDRPPISERNNERESPDRAKANKKYSNTANIFLIWSNCLACYIVTEINSHQNREIISLSHNTII